MNAPEQPPCQHPRKRIIAQDEHATFYECLDCGAILEAGELDGDAGQGESLSDA